uniref:Uncharacterized protein n=1 Tax=Oryza glumipatula TaxID=40148 RepID=A0A0E0BIF3_9ORYZ
MEQDQPPSGVQLDNSRKHERSTRSSTATRNTKESCRSGPDVQLYTPLSPTCSSGLLISDKSPKGCNLLGGQGTFGISGAGDTGKGLPGPAPYWSVNSSYESIPISALPPKKRYLRQLQLAQQLEVSPPAVPVAVPAQVPLAGSNSGVSFGQKSKQDNSLGPINWRSTRWWNYRKRSSDDADNAEKKDAANYQEAGNSIAGKRNRVEWGYGLAKYEKGKKQMSNSLPSDGDNTNLGASSESMTATVDCPAALPASSLGSNVQPGDALN